MTNQSFHCPQCGADIEISEVLSNQIKRDIEQDFQKEKSQALDHALKHAEERFEEQLKNRQAQMSIELADLQAQVIEKTQQAQNAERQELEIRKKARELEQKQQQMDIEIQRRLDDEKQTLADQIRRQFDEDHELKLKEKERQIQDLRESVAEIKRRSEVGSQEAQGELLEMDMEDKLRRAFPQDRFQPVSKGVRGADLMQEVYDATGQLCGQIIWEAKNTKRWSGQWIEKLKDDQREASAQFAILVSQILPPSVERLGQVEGVWVCDLHSFIGLATALRGHLVDLDFAKKASQGKSEKVEMVYEYLSGSEFKHRIEAIVESFNSMQDQLMRERRAMEKIWKEREKQIQRITINTVGMYGEMRGIIGGGLPHIPALELDSDDSIE